MIDETSLFDIKLGAGNLVQHENKINSGDWFCQMYRSSVGQEFGDHPLIKKSFLLHVNGAKDGAQNKNSIHTIIFNDKFDFKGVNELYCVNSGGVCVLIEFVTQDCIIEQKCSDQDESFRKRLFCVDDEGYKRMYDCFFSHGDFGLQSGCVTSSLQHTNSRCRNRFIFSCVYVCFSSVCDGEEVHVTPMMCDDQFVSIIKRDSPSIQLYPNPSHGTVIVKYPNESFSISIYNEYGKCIISERDLHKKFRINIETAGVYFVQLRSDKIVRTQKLIISN